MAELSAAITGRFRSEATQRTDLPGVGDFVAVRLTSGEGMATIEAVLPRTSAMVRKAAGERRPQLLAANIDVAFIMTAMDGDFNNTRKPGGRGWMLDSSSATRSAITRFSLQVWTNSRYFCQFSKNRKLPLGSRFFRWHLGARAAAARLPWRRR